MNKKIKFTIITDRQQRCVINVSGDEYIVMRVEDAIEEARSHWDEDMDDDQVTVFFIKEREDGWKSVAPTTLPIGVEFVRILATEMEA
jgi:hypothetical protein